MYKWFQNHFLLAVVFFLTAIPVWAAKFNIVYEDGGNFGFNAATARDPVGGNNGTTLGQQRRNVVEKAAEIWGQYLESDVEIEISAKFEAFCSTSLFTTNDFINLKALVLKFKNPTDPVSQFLESQFDFSTQRLLAAYDDESEEPSELLQDAIIEELNWVLQGDSIYGANRFSGVSEQIKNLAEQDREVIEPICLNRLLLLAAYPSEIKSSNGNGAILASGGPARFHESFTNSPATEVWYASALANSIAGEDLKPNEPDIEISVNALIDVPEAKVLNGNGFYYGHDNNISVQINLLSTLLHEIGHGLGFISSISLIDGSFLLGDTDEPKWPDSFSRLIKDMKTGKLWIEMSANERFEAVSSNPNITFTGACTKQSSQLILKPEEADESVSQNDSGMLLIVNGSNESVMTYEGEASEFGLGVPIWGISGKLVLVDDGVGTKSDACQEPFVNANDIRGRIAVIDRGGGVECVFVDKVRRAQDAGALAVVIVNINDDNSGLFMTGDGIFQPTGTNFEITIPTIFIGKSDGDLVKEILPEAYATLTNNNKLSGTQNNMININALSVSHWSPEVFPQLLMESETLGPTRPDLDLTLPALRDIGWKISNIPFPHLSFELWADEYISGSEREFDDDPDADGSVNLMEYAFGTHPEDAASIPASMEFSSSSNGENLFTLRYKRSPAPADIIFSVTKASSLMTPAMGKFVKSFFRFYVIIFVC